MTLPCCTSQAEAPSGTSQNTTRSRTARDGPSAHVPTAPEPLHARYDAVRAASVAFAQGLSDADATVQSMPDASPIKWHLAHTTWFFETFLLGESGALSGALSGRRYRPFDPRFAYLFNSYYEAAGPRHPRPQRGLLTRPTLDDVLRYRQHVDAAMHELLLHADLSPEVHALITLGLHHEEQHQELMHTDLLHLFAQNPLRPAHRHPSSANEVAGPLHWIAHDGGQHRIGHPVNGANESGGQFAFDCETPAHDVLLRPFAIASRVVTNGEWRAFIEDGGYRMAGLWLSDGWATVQREGWGHPMYWELHQGEWQSMTLAGMQPIDDDAPVRHVSYFEADAFARWAGKRLPTEQEWEVAASAAASATSPTQQAMVQCFGPVWQWTASPYVAYPGFRTAAGAVGEYNGKFMCGQFVLRGGSLATPPGHARATYRNFFYPHQRWQFCGLRLAEDR